LISVNNHKVVARNNGYIRIKNLKYIVNIPYPF